MTKSKWTSEQTYHLLEAMKGYRPFGVEKHFHMMFILERFRAKCDPNVTADILWDHIEEYYNINKLTERETERLSKQKPVEYDRGDLF